MIDEIIDTHFHGQARSTNDYEQLALSGITTVISPSHRLRVKIYKPEQYFEIVVRMYGDEQKRAEAFGIKLFVGIGVSPSDFVEDAVFYQVLEALPARASKLFPALRCLGEVELDLSVADPEKKFLKQIEVFGGQTLPVVVNIPHINRKPVFDGTLVLMDQMVKQKLIDKSIIMLDGLRIEEIPLLQNRAYGSFGVPVSPRLDAPMVVFRKSFPDEICKVLSEKKIDVSNVIFNSSMGFGYGDPWGMARVAHYILNERPEYQKDLEGLFFSNANRFFGLSQ